MNNTGSTSFPLSDSPLPMNPPFKSSIIYSAAKSYSTDVSHTKESLLKPDSHLISPELKNEVFNFSTNFLLLFSRDFLI